MKKATVQITYDAEKLGAIRQYMGKKDAELQSEMEDFLQKLYEKHVPAPVRDYIESREPSEPEAPRRPSRPAAPARPQNHSAGGGE
jgi:hypothetical protein